MTLTHFILFVICMILFYLLGYRVKNVLERKGLLDSDNLGIVESSMLALFAFFLGFTFSISANKINEVRKSSIAESNAIGTALLRTDLYSDSDRHVFHNLFRTYVKSRVAYFDSNLSKDSSSILLKASLQEAQKIWDFAINKSHNKDYVEATRLMIPATNDMIDSVSDRDSDIKASLPNSIIWTLFALSFCSCFIVGFSIKNRLLTNFIGMIYILFVALTVNLIIDAGDPRSGMINTKKANQDIIDIYNQLQEEN